jgi:hypothetical protein
MPLCLIFVAAAVAVAGRMALLLLPVVLLLLIGVARQVERVELVPGQPFLLFLVLVVEVEPVFAWFMPIISKMMVLSVLMAERVAMAALCSELPVVMAAVAAVVWSWCFTVMPWVPVWVRCPRQVERQVLPAMAEPLEQMGLLLHLQFKEVKYESKY